MFYSCSIVAGRIHKRLRNKFGYPMTNLKPRPLRNYRKFFDSYVKQVFLFFQIKQSKDDCI